MSPVDKTWNNPHHWNPWRGGDWGVELAKNTDTFISKISCPLWIRRSLRLKFGMLASFHQRQDLTAVRHYSRPYANGYRTDHRQLSDWYESGWMTSRVLFRLRCVCVCVGCRRYHLANSCGSQVRAGDLEVSHDLRTFVCRVMCGAAISWST